MVSALYLVFLDIKAAANVQKCVTPTLFQIRVKMSGKKWGKKANHRGRGDMLHRSVRGSENLKGQKSFEEEGFVSISAEIGVCVGGGGRL